MTPIIVLTVGRLSANQLAFRGLPAVTSTVTQVRSISLDKLSNKKITRLESDIQLDDQGGAKGRLFNRNPRNLELLSFEKKPSGFWLDKNSRSNSYNLIFQETDRNLEAHLVHWSGRKVISAATWEPKLQKYFNSTTSTQAAQVIAQVIARRCQQAGFLTMGVANLDPEQSISAKTKAFYECVEENGLELQEPPEIEPRAVTDL